MIGTHDLIARWQQCERVLIDMPEHERQHHWDMSKWGYITDCGTVNCAAGKCGLDPWFRQHGFTFDFDGDGDSNITDVPSFFGLEGSSRIFLDTTLRPVEKVITEVQQYRAELERLAKRMARADLPAIGEQWQDQGGRFAGACPGRNGEPDYFLIVGPECDGLATWHRASEWAPTVVVGNHKDFKLPFRNELRLCFDRVRHLFQRDSYWSCEQHVSYSDFAWYQYFDYGGQDFWVKDLSLRARAVRISIR